MVELVLEFVGRILLELFVHIIFGIIFYHIGWPIMKVATLGKFPKDWRPLGLDIAVYSKTDLIVCWIGALTTVAIVIHLVTSGL
jgi:hypothetical protein